MGFKMLKDAGFVPPEVEVIKEIASLRHAMAVTADPKERFELQQKLRDLELSLSIAKDRLSGNRLR